MKTMIVCALGLFVAAIVSGCESDEHHHHGYQGGPPAYERGAGSWGNQWDQTYRGPDWNHNWDAR